MIIEEDEKYMDLFPQGIDFENPEVINKIKK